MWCVSSSVCFCVFLFVLERCIVLPLRKFGPVFRIHLFSQRSFLKTHVPSGADACAIVSCKLSCRTGHLEDTDTKFPVLQRKLAAAQANGRSPQHAWHSLPSAGEARHIDEGHCIAPFIFGCWPLNAGGCRPAEFRFLFHRACGFARRGAKAVPLLGGTMRAQVPELHACVESSYN